EKNLWRKCANLLNNVRRDLRPWSFVDPTNQKREAEKYARHALKDTHLPDDVKTALKSGMSVEFGFTFPEEKTKLPIKYHD
ncbi:hypothetical protein, partial [Bradyrhizobium sp. 23AC]